MKLRIFFLPTPLQHHLYSEVQQAHIQLDNIPKFVKLEIKSFHLWKNFHVEGMSGLYSPSTCI